MAFSFKHSSQILNPEIKDVQDPATLRSLDQIMRLVFDSFKNIYDDLFMLSEKKRVKIFNDTLTLTNGGVYVATITGTKTWTFPPIAKSIGKYFYVKNRGSATLTMARSGSDQLYDTSAVTSIAVTAGSGVMFINDGTYWTKVI